MSKGYASEDSNEVYALVATSKFTVSGGWKLSKNRCNGLIGHGSCPGMHSPSVDTSQHGEPRIIITENDTPRTYKSTHHN